MPKSVWEKKGLLLSVLLFCMLLIMSVGMYGCAGEAGGTGGSEEETAAGEDKNDDSNSVDPQEEARRQEAERLAEEKKLREEHRLREEQLREELGLFFVPLPPLEQEDNPPVQARGIYLTGHSVGHRERFPRLLQMVEETELNTMVIDAKDDHGLMSYPSSIEIVQEVGADNRVPVSNMEEVLQDLHDRGIYTIARIVVFKDPFLAEKRPDWAIQKNEGGAWRDRKGDAWVNPYDKDVWKYNVAIAKEAALLGFREIQFDYVRFPENARRVDQEAFYPGQNDMPKDEAIENFLIFAREELEEYNVYLAADVFGVIVTSWGDSDQIGQSWEKIAPHVDYNCPMIYPSHYGPGYFNLPVPDAEPATTVKRALEDALKRNAPIKDPGIIRPWLQSFTASWVRGNISYGPQEVREQIDTALKLGIEEYLVWNANNRYQPEAFLTEEEAEDRAAEVRRSREEKSQDFLGRNPREAVEIYLEASRQGKWREAYPLQATGFSIGPEDFREWMNDWSGKPASFEVKEKEENSGRIFVNLDVTISLPGEGEEELLDETWEVIKENDIWKVKPSKDFLEALVYEEPPPEGSVGARFFEK